MEKVLQSAAEMLIWALGFILFLGLTLACEAGYRLGVWRGRRKPKTDEVTASSTITAGMLALLAFMLGLTISFAQNRFEARRELVAVEANAIGTAWLRAKLIGGPEGETLASEITDYAKTRLAFTAADYYGPVTRLETVTGEQQARIWALVTTIARRNPTPISATLVNAVNAMIDSSLSQRFAFETHVPGHMVAILMGGSLLAISALGFELGLLGYRQPVMTSLLLLMWTGGIVMTVDLNRPRLGNIRVETAPLRWTLGGMAPTPPGPSPTPVSPSPSR